MQNFKYRSVLLSHGFGTHRFEQMWDIVHNRRANLYLPENSTRTVFQTHLKSGLKLGKSQIASLGLKLATGYYPYQGILVPLPLCLLPSPSISRASVLSEVGSQIGLPTVMVHPSSLTPWAFASIDFPQVQHCLRLPPECRWWPIWVDSIIHGFWYSQGVQEPVILNWILHNNLS